MGKGYAMMAKVLFVMLLFSSHSFYSFLPRFFFHISGDYSLTHLLRSLNANLSCVYVCVLQILGHGSFRIAVSAWPHMVIWALLHQRGLDCNGIPFHHLQHFPRNVYLHFSLSPPEKGKFLFYVQRKLLFFQCKIPLNLNWPDTTAVVSHQKVLGSNPAWGAFWKEFACSVRVCLGFLRYCGVLPHSTLNCP